MSSAPAPIGSTALGVPPPPVAGVRRSRRRFWDQASIYLPVLLMGLLALASYWLLRATPSAFVAAPERPVTHEPDYFMRGFSVKVFDQSGALKSEVFGAEARHHPDTDTTVIDNARIRSFNEAGQLSTATARRVTSNSDNTEFILEGDAVVVREAGQGPNGQPLPRLEFRGDYLRVHANPERLVSDRPVQLMRGKDRILADTLDYRGEQQQADFKGRVRAQLVPR